MKYLTNKNPMVPLGLLQRAVGLCDESVDIAVAGTLCAMDPTKAEHAMDAIRLLRALTDLSARLASDVAGAIDAPGGTPEGWAQAVEGRSAELRDALAVAADVSGVLAHRLRRKAGA